MEVLEAWVLWLYGIGQNQGAHALFSCSFELPEDLIWNKALLKVRFRTPVSTWRYHHVGIAPRTVERSSNRIVVGDFMLTVIEILPEKVKISKTTKHGTTEGWYEEAQIALIPIAPKIYLSIKEIRGDTVRIAIHAPTHIRVSFYEIYDGKDVWETSIEEREKEAESIIGKKPEDNPQEDEWDVLLKDLVNEGDTPHVPLD